MKNTINEISNLQEKILNNENSILNNIKTEIGKLGFNYSSNIPNIDKELYNNLYKFENEVNQNEDEDIELFLPKYPLNIIQEQNDNKDELIKIIDTINKKNKIYELFKVDELNRKISSFNSTNESQEQIDETQFPLIKLINKYKKLKLTLSYTNFKTELCINHIEINFQIDSTLINYDINININSELEIFNNKLKDIFHHTEDTLYNIEKIIINPDLSVILNKNYILNNESLKMCPYILTKDVVEKLNIYIIKIYNEIYNSNLDKYIITNSNFADKYEKLNEKLDIIVETVKKVEEWYNYYRTNYYISDLQTTEISNINLAINNFKSNTSTRDIGDNIANYNNIIEKYTEIIEKLNKLNEKIIEQNNYIEEKLQPLIIKTRAFINSVTLKLPSDKVKRKIKIYEDINKELLEIDKDLNREFSLDDKYEQLQTIIEKYNHQITNNKKYTNDNLELFGGSSINRFDDYFNQIVDFSILNKDKKIKKNNNINIEDKVELNNLLFNSHILFIINLKNINIKNNLNKEVATSYLNKINNLLLNIKNHNKLYEYLLKFHYFNLKILKDFFNGLVHNNWVTNKDETCEKNLREINEILEISDNEEIYFNLLDINYDVSIKKAIFIFFGIKQLLDKITLNIDGTILFEATQIK